MSSIDDEEWQRLRLSLKGIPTEDKLIKLDNYLTRNPLERAAQVRVDNYINALLRGGQLIYSKGAIVVQR